METQSGLHRAPDDTFNHRTLLKDIDFCWKKFLIKKRNLGTLRTGDRGPATLRTCNFEDMRL